MANILVNVAGEIKQGDLNGLPENDVFTIAATANNSISVGLGGNDTFNINSAVQSITASGGEGNDTFNLGIVLIRNHILNGGNGNDTFNVGGDSLTMNGDAGDDTFNMNTSQNNTVSGGADRDTFVLTSNANGNVVKGDGGVDKFEIRSGSFNNDIQGGDSGDEVRVFTNAANQFDGGSGFDWLSFEGRTTAVTVNAATEVYTGGNTIANFEGFGLGQGNDTFIGATAATSAANVADEIVLGFLGNDTLNGGDGDDILVGSTWDLATNNWTIEAASTTNTLIGGRGNDTMVSGGAGDNINTTGGDASDIDTVVLTSGGNNAGDDRIIVDDLSDVVQIFGFTAGIGTGNNNNDRINIAATSLDTFSQVLSVTREYRSGSDFGVIIQLDADSELFIANVLTTQLTANDFIF